jgi:hypothetical protein
MVFTNETHATHVLITISSIEKEIPMALKKFP